MDPISIPKSHRFNAWREWKPIVATMGMDNFHVLQREVQGIANPEVAAVHQYVRCTGFEVIEFVFLANFADGSAYREYPAGIVAVPCMDVLAAAESDGPFPVPRSEHIYDAFAPLKSTDPAAISDKILEIDDVLNVLAYTHGISLRWFPKYIEAVKRPTPMRVFPDGKGAHADEVQSFADLPASIRPAVARAVHWITRAAQERDATDKFAHFWFAFEGLALALHENASDVCLPLAADQRLPKSERKRMAEAKIREIMAATLENDPRKAVRDAYFQAIGSIRAQTEAVLCAAFGENHDFVHWVYGEGGPAKLRNDLVHQGWSSQEFYHNYPLDEIVLKMERLAASLVKRTVTGRWLGIAHPPEAPNTFTQLILPANVIACSPGGGWQIRGEFVITHQLLAEKGLL